MDAAAGWYDDGHGTQRWWDGSTWTEQVRDVPPPTAVHPQSMTIAPQAPATPTRRTAASPAKPPLFGVRNFAVAQAAEAFELRQTIDRLGLADVLERERRVAELDTQIAEKQSHIVDQTNALAVLLRDVDTANAELLDVRNAVEVQEFGVFDFEHPAEASAELATKLEATRSEIKRMISDKTAASASSNFTFNNSAAQGRRFTANMMKILLRAYNAEAENGVKAVRAGNLHTAQSRLSKAAEQIQKQGSMISLEISPHFHRLRLHELELANRHLVAIQREKELERERREQLREQRKAEQELQREHDRLEKEKSHYLATLASLEANGDDEGVLRMRAKLEDVDRALTDVDYRAANIRAGYVYVISNVGAFGDGIVKIGMTRRLEPMDRVNELGDASVPFRFDVHALFFADDAVGIESMLHGLFADQRLNRVNLRREFFAVSPQQVLDALQSHKVEVVEFALEPAAEEFRLSEVARLASIADEQPLLAS